MTPPSTSSPSPGPETMPAPFSCPVCDKKFERKDLKERHRRRCEKSSQIVRAPRKRACESCIASKVKCDLALPSCSRCASRGAHCHYEVVPSGGNPPRPPTTNPPSEDRQFPIAASETSTAYDFPEPGFSYSSTPSLTSLADYSTAPAPALLGPPLMVNAGDAPQLLPDEGVGTNFDDILFDSWQHLGNQDLDMLTGNGFDPHNPHAASHPPPLMNDYRSRDASSNSSALSLDMPPNLTQFQMVDEARSYREKPRGRQWSNLGHVSPLPDADLTFPEQDVIRLDGHGNPKRSSRHGSLFSSAPFPGPVSLDTATRSATFSSPASIEGDDDALPASVQRLISALRPLGPGPMSLDRCVEVVIRYPVRMLDESFDSPFIHCLLTRNPVQDTPSPVEIAIACIGMKLLGRKPGMPFVCSTFQEQRAKLMATLPNAVDQGMEPACAAIHAMAIFQIQGLLSPDRCSSPMSSAELCHEYLVKGARRLFHNYIVVLTTPTPDTADWRTWAVQESIRRTFLLVHLLHQLLGHTERIAVGFFEPVIDLDDTRRLILPAPDDVWSAPDAFAWREARDRARTRSRAAPVTVGDALIHAATIPTAATHDDVDCGMDLDEPHPAAAKAPAPILAVKPPPAPASELGDVARLVVSTIRGTMVLR